MDLYRSGRIGLFQLGSPRTGDRLNETTGGWSACQECLENMGLGSA